jgi:hypothetical protein
MSDITRIKFAHGCIIEAADGEYYRCLDVDAEIHSLRQQVAELEADRERLGKLVYLPGIHECRKCNLLQISTNLHVMDGSTSADNTSKECANGCGPMWKVTYKDSFNEVMQRAEKAESQLSAYREALERLRDCDWVITPHDRMDAVRDIARKALTGDTKCEHGKGLTDYCEPCGRIHNSA